MASSDEDDIESLRLAALASIKPKVDQEPQGIQVVSSIQQPVAPVQPFFEQQPVQQYFDQQPVQPYFGHKPVQPYFEHKPLPPYFEHKPVQPYFEQKPVQPYFEQKPVDHIDPHFAALHHAFLQHQQQIQQQQQPPPFYVRGRGNFRGRGFFPRGRGRGRGYNMFQPDMNSFHVTPVQPQSALIVIQTEVPEAEKKKSQEPRPLFLRPQDKWGLANTSSRGSSPKPKDTSKFSRYDSDSDSDDDFESMETENIDDAEAEDELDCDDNVEDENNDTDKSIDNSFVETEEIQSDNNSEDVNNDIDEPQENDSLTANNPTRIVKVKVKEESDKLEPLDKTDEKLFEEKADKLLNTNTELTISNSKESGALIENNGHKLDAAFNNVDDTDEVKTGDNENCDTEIESQTDPEATTATITDEHVRPEIRQDESVSNSYSSFSRFNRRRKKSDSGEESDSENDDANSKHSDWSTASKDKLQNVSDDSADSEPETGTHELETEATQVDQGSVKEKTILSRSRSKSASKSQVGSPSRSSSSSSSSSSASSSSSSSTSLSRNSSPEPSKKAGVQDITSQPKVKEKSSEQKVSKLNNLNDASKKRSNSSSNIKIGDSRDKNKESGRAKYADKTHKSDGHRRNSASDVKPKSDRVGENSLSPKTKNYTSSQRSRSPRPLSGRSRTPDKKNKHFSLSPLRDKSAVVAADPEFDAANYRGDGVFHREKAKRKNDPGKSEKENKQSIVRQDISVKDRRKTDMDSEVRYFKEITKLKSEQTKEPRKMDSQENNKNDIHTEKRRRKDDRVAKDQSVRASQSEHLVKKNSKDRNRIRSISPKLDRKQYKRSKSKSPVLKEPRSKTNPKYTKSSENFVDKRSRDSRTFKSSTELDRERRKDRHDKNTKVPERKHKVKSVSDKGKDVTNKEKRKSIEEKLKKIANLSSSSSSDSDSGKSVSSLSDMSSDSESETWRNKKTGASRKADDIVRERQRRKVLEREKRRNLEREREIGDGDRSRKRTQDRNKSEQNRPERNVDKKHKLDSSFRDRHIENKKSVFSAEDSKRKPVFSTEDSKRKPVFSAEDSKCKPMFSAENSKRKPVFSAEDSKRKPVFEELSSDSDTDRSKNRRVSSIVKPNIPSLLDIKVSKTNLSKLDKHAKNERLVIQVGKSSDEDADGVRSKIRHKKTKKGEKRKKSSDNPSDDENWSRKHVVSVTFNDDSGSDSGNPRRSVYDRLGIQVSTENNQRSSKSKSKKQPDTVVPSSDKKIKLNDRGKHSSKKQKKTSKQEQVDPDEALNKRIRKIQEKNAEILRRKMEVEQDKQKYG